MFDSSLQPHFLTANRCQELQILAQKTQKTLLNLTKVCDLLSTNILNVNEL